MTVTKAVVRERHRLRVLIDRTVDGTTRQLVHAWAVAWEEVAAEFEAAIDDLMSAGEWPTRGALIRADRARRLLQLTSEKITELAALAGVTISNQLQAMVRQADRMERAMIASQLPADVTLGRISPEAIRQIVERTTEQIVSSLRPLAPDAVAAMRSALIRGVMVGDNPREAARQMLRRTHTVFDGGRWRAENIARTEMLEAHRKAARVTREANKDLLSGWVWSADLSSRTCPACLSMHGTRWPATEDGPNGHPSCRCAAIPVTLSWAELGFDGIEDTNPALPDAEQWFNSQPVDVQKQIMGQTRLDAYRDGRMSWDQMAVKRENPGWRPSFQVAPVPPE